MPRIHLEYVVQEVAARQASRRSDLLSAQDDNRYTEATLGHAIERDLCNDRALRECRLHMQLDEI